MKKKHLLLLIAFISINGFSQTTKVYDGQIDNYPIEIYLAFNKDRVTGYYIYQRIGQPIYLEGERKNNVISLNEALIENGTWGKTGAKFTWTESINPKGKWVNNDKTLSISLSSRDLKQEWTVTTGSLELIHNFQDGKTGKFPIEVSLMYPDHSNLKLFRLLLSKIFNIKEDNNYLNFWDYFNQFTLKQFKDYLGDFTPTYHPYYSLSMSGNLVYLSDSIMTYSISGSGYSGGAQGYTFTDYYVFDIKNNKEIVFNTIFKEGAEKSIAEKISEKSNHRHNTEKIKQKLYNFYITNKGIGFYFGQDVLECHSCGVYEYFFKFEELKNELK